MQNRRRYNTESQGVLETNVPLVSLSHLLCALVCQILTFVEGNVLGLLFASPATVLVIIPLKMCRGAKASIQILHHCLHTFSPPTCWVSNGVDQTGEQGKGIRQPFCGSTGLDSSVCFCPLVCVCFFLSFYLTT